ncbi:uncharacterized protein BT62DRAFT_935554 [Guyanagaster necrorhizus]|uniref:Protein kinase domain-containing protein n=1 Tax=Guyanagaster necrorhizus TaxID=856835 RepID=A0A9P8ANZ8_9AGAR|nr:uncharacterized protein BT62DRAFT_935554 [Guyanagaster necrorhizus MCA 3950]KAG7442818.1 hypothetical protein BT62DRAFT_935554 [Guyanagaster necrorhizus MCA 3950]
MTRSPSLGWMAPELIRSDEVGRDIEGKPASRDVYSFGCTLVQIHTKHHPYADTVDREEVYRSAWGKSLRFLRNNYPLDACTTLFSIVSKDQQPIDQMQPKFQLSCRISKRNKTGDSDSQKRRRWL